MWPQARIRRSSGRTPLMLFCSFHFLVFFSAVFAIYWTLDRRVARTAAFLLAAGYLGYKSFTYWETVHFGFGQLENWKHWLDALNRQFGLAVSVCVAVIQSRFLGVHQARVWLLLMVSFCF